MMVHATERRRFRLSVRSLMIAVAVCALVLVPVIWVARQTALLRAEQMRAIDAERRARAEAEQAQYVAQVRAAAQAQFDISKATEPGRSSRVRARCREGGRALGRPRREPRRLPPGRGEGAEHRVHAGQRRRSGHRPEDRRVPDRRQRRGTGGLRAHPGQRSPRRPVHRPAAGRAPPVRLRPRRPLRGAGRLPGLVAGGELPVAGGRVPGAGRGRPVDPIELA